MKTRDLLTRRGTRSIFPETRVAERYNTYIKEKWVAGWTKGVGYEREKLAGRPRPLRSRNDIKVFQELSVRDTPYPTSQSPHTLPIPHTAFPLPRLGLLFKGGFQGCGVPINNSLSLSLSPVVPPLVVPSTHPLSSHLTKVCAPSFYLILGDVLKMATPPFTSLRQKSNVIQCI